VVTLHQGVGEVVASSGRSDYWVRRIVVRANRVTTTSRSVVDDVTAQGCTFLPAVTIVPNAVDELWFSGDLPRCSESYVLYAGRLHHAKGVDTFLEAWSRGCASWPQHGLLIVGSGPEKESLLTQAALLGLGDRVTFCPPADKASLLRLYQRSSCVVVPSRSEPFGLVAAEAMAAGAIVIASAVGGLQGLVEDGVSGFLVEPDAPQQLAKVLARALSLSDTQRNRIRHAARDRMRSLCSPAVEVARYIDVYRSVTGQSATTTL
jgi:glycosyltransferase involved in cell wall biosynthesis